MNQRYRLAQQLTRFVPRTLRDWVRLHVPLTGYDLARLRERNPYAHIQGEEFDGSPVRLGIIIEETHSHRHYIAACREMKVSYRVMDILADNWVTEFRDCDCDAFLVWPCSLNKICKEAFDYRLRLLEKDLGKLIFPTWRECWLTEHKPRLRDWLLVHDIAHPRSWVVYRKEDAQALAATLDLPVVSKSALGACGSGVRILNDIRELRSYIKLFFGSGLAIRGYDPRDRHRGYMFIQEYLPGAQEWRMVRIGDSFFGYRKEKGETGLHSASHRWSWLDPGEKLLELLKKVTDTGDFRSMDVDVFLAADGRILVNECQTTFGCTTPAEQMKIEGIEGRYLYRDQQWRFEPGVFCRNHMCNLRIEYLLSVIQSR